MSRQRLVVLAALMAGLGGCNNDKSEAATEGQPPGPPPTTSTTTDTGTDTTTTIGTTTGADVPCSVMAPCTDGFCVAPVPIGQGMRPEDGEFFCRAQCLPNGTANLWCLDAGSCCDPTATCNEQGFCIGESTSGTGGSTGGTGGSTGGGSTGGGSTGGGSTGGSTGSTGAAT